jgi:DNA-binding GntR family transcriptional regulator
MLLRATSLRAPGRSGASLAELSDMMDALDEKDGKKARALAEHHVRTAAKAAIALLYSQPEPAPAKPKRAVKQTAAAERA